MPEELPTPSVNCATSSTAHWIAALQAGQDAAANRLWNEYFARLTALARRKLRASPKRVADEEDIALSAFNSFCRNAANGRFPQLKDQDDLWRLLFTITERKAIRQLKHDGRQKRGGGQVRGESVLFSPGSEEVRIEHVSQSPEPTPDMAMALAENVSGLLDALEDEKLKHVAVAKMEGFTNAEIAQQLDCSERSIKRKLQVIRTSWIAWQEKQ